VSDARDTRRRGLLFGVGVRAVCDKAAEDEEVIKRERASKMVKGKLRPMDSHTIGILEKRWEDARLNCHDAWFRVAQHDGDDVPPAVYARAQKFYEAEIDAACKLAGAMYRRGLIGLIADKLRLEDDGEVEEYLRGQ
jgi:hypothetical protein